MVGGAYITAIIINMLAEGFGSVKNFNKAFALVVYSYTPMCIAGVLYMIPSLGIVVSLAGLYGLYIMYIGLQPMMKTQAEKTQSYFIVSLICTIAVTAILSLVLAAIFITRGYASLF
jgi:hypothetical protein